MNSMKKKALLMSMMVASMVLTGCGKTDNTPSNNSSNKTSVAPTSSALPEDKIPEEPVEEGGPFEEEIGADWPSYTVTFDYQGNGTNATQNVKYKGKLTKPADPTAPAGKKFYGWMNAADGGRIWNFNRKMLNAVMGDMTLVPCFIDANKKLQTFEAEYCPDIMGEDGTGMWGATYSGGNRGKGLIKKDWDYEYSASHKVGALNADGDEYLPGAFVHFLYVQGNTLTWKLNASAADTNVTLFARFGAEYGATNEDYGLGRKYSFTDEMFTIKVNDDAVTYGTITIRNAPSVDGAFLPFSDYMVSATVNLKAGENIIQMKVDNNITIYSSAGATSPTVDAIRLVTSSDLTWPEEDLSNMEID